MPLTITISRYPTGLKQADTLISQQSLVSVHYVTVVESEAHVLLHCALYKDIRSELFLSISEQLECFKDLDDQNKLIVILTGKHCMYECAKACPLIHIEKISVFK